MSEELTKYSAGSLVKGIDVFQGNMAPDLIYDMETFNLTTGINEGIGPRFAMAPLPGHNSTDLVSTACPGFMRAETNWDSSTTISAKRTKVFGIFPINLAGPGASIGTKSDYYAAIVGYTSSSYSGKTILECIILSTYDGTLYNQATPFYSGFSRPLLETAAIQINVATEMVSASGTVATRATAMGKLLDTQGLQHVCIAPATVTGPDVPMQWVFGETAASDADATHCRNMKLWVALNLNAALGHCYMGPPPDVFYGNFKTAPRIVTVYGLTSKLERNVDWKMTFIPTTGKFSPENYYQNSGDQNWQLYGAGTTVKTSAAAATYATVIEQLVNDSACTINSSYKAFLIAGLKPIMVLIQDWYRSGDGCLPQYVDLVANPQEPPIYDTQLSAVADYLEDGTPKKTCFAGFPSFSSSAATSATASGLGVMTVNTGILRANTSYEFTFSVYNKRLNYESNVGVPVKFRTFTDDFVSFALYSTTTDGFGHTFANWIIDGGYNGLVPFPGDGSSISTSQSTMHLNYLEYRFYYRPLGSFEWLPALFIDAAKFWFYPWHKPLLACTGAIGGLPGGQPGGFNDYSRLPDDKYTCVVQYKNRAFWLSDKAGIFSLRNNFFAYPGRNSFALPTGKIKGAIVHNYPGQAEQSSRLLVFGSVTSYVGRFTGNLQEVPLQIGDNTVNFGLDGSDFVLDPWTSNTAFSYRSAVVARGILFFWGPDGFFRDGGVDTPEKISDDLEPDLFTMFDTSDTDNIHCVYNDKTKEIYWFYKPKVADGFATHAFVYDTKQMTFLRAKFVGQIDAAQAVTISTSEKTSGDRVVVFARADGSGTIQRPYFFDHRNRAGDLRPTADMVVKSFTSPTTTTRLLSLAPGSAAISSLAVGDYITVHQAKDYCADLTLADDLVGKVTAFNNGATPKTITIQLPTGAQAAAFDASLTISDVWKYFPIWHSGASTAGLNGISYQMKSKYWMPGGADMTMYWMFLYLRFGVQLFKYIDKPRINLQYRTPVSTALVTDNPIRLFDNSDGNYQLYRNMTPGDRGTEGQALRMILSGNHIGHAWVLQWLEAHGNQQPYNFLKEFEG